MPPSRRPLTGPATMVRWRFPPPSSPNCSVRTLTIGVLIVTTGTLAALPFRNPPTDGPVDPPTRSPESGPYGALVADSWPDRPSDSHPAENPPAASPLSRSAEQPRNLPSSVTVSGRGTAARDRSTANDLDGSDRNQDRFATAPPKRHAALEPFASEPNAPSVPTYEDWMIPVGDSQLIRERFSATIAAERSEPRSEKGHSSDLPDEPDPSVERQTETDTRPTAALPASLKTIPPSTTDSDASARERHWIRQPG